jgi:phospholipase C
MNISTVPSKRNRLRGALLALAILLCSDHSNAQTDLVKDVNTTPDTISTNIAVPSSSGTTYVLTKYSPGKLTLTGQLTGGAGSILRTTTQTSGDSTTVFEFSGSSTSYSGGIQLWRGIVQADNASALGTGTIYGDGNNSTTGDLTFGAGMTFANPIVLQENDTIGSGTFSVTLSGAIGDGGGGFGITKYGSGTLTLSGVNTYSGTTSIGGSTAAGGTLAVGVNNGIPSGTPLVINNISGTSVLSLGAFNQNVGSVTLYAGNSARTIVTGTGKLQMSGNLTLVDSHTSSQDYPLTISAPIDLNGATRTFTVGYGNNAESTDLGDLHLNGVISTSSGTAGITFAPYTTYNGSVTLGAANTYNGPTTLTTASGGNGTSTLALNANNAFPNNSAFVQSAGTILDLTAWNKTTGISTGMGSLTGAGTITLGSAGVLTIGYDNTSPAAYSGAIGGAGGSLVKTGTGTLTLSGANTFTGTFQVNGGKVYVNGNNSGGGAVGVASGATLGGTGTISAAVTVANGGILEAGSGGTGTLALKSLTLGSSGSDNLTLNFTGTGGGIVTTITLTSGLTLNGTSTFNFAGTLPGSAPATYTLMTYAGTSTGSGTLSVGSIPAYSGMAYISNNTTAKAIQLVIPPPSTPSVTWVGSPQNTWNLSGGNVWKQTGTSTATSYADPDQVVFDDSAANFTVNLAAAVKPTAVTVSNALNNYTISGSGSIGDGSTLTKLGTAKLILSTANVYTGNTTITGGTLALGASGAIPSGPSAGSVTVNGTLDVAGFSPTVNNLAGAGVVDNVTAGGSPVVTASNSLSSTFSGTVQNTSGALAISKSGSGTLTLSGNNSYKGGTTLSGGGLGIAGATGLGTGPLTVTEDLAGGTATFLTVGTSSAVTLTNNFSLPNTSGTYALVKNQTGKLSLSNTISGGGSGFTLQTSSDTVGDTTTIFEFAGNNSSYAGNIQTFRGVVQVDNAMSLGTGTIYCDANNSATGDLWFNSSMTFANPLVLQSASSLSPGANTVTMNGGISGGPATLTKYGSGTLNLTGNLGFNGGLVANTGTLGIGSLILAGDTTAGDGPAATSTNYISIASGATLQSSGTLSLYESSALKPYIGVSGAGTLALTGVNNSASSPDISFAPNDTTPNGTANWGARIATPINLGGIQRYIWGRTDHTSVDVYGLTQADCQFAGAISGSGGLTFIAQDNSSGNNGQLMETPFCLNAANTFTGPVIIQRGSVYLGASGAFPSGNTLTFNVASGNNGKFFLYGQNATVSDLSSTGAGNALIANGNRNPSPIGPATLTIVQNNSATYSGTIIDTNAEYVNTTTGATTTLSLVKSGPATLSLNGTVAFSGPMTVNAGKLYMNTTSSGGGAVTVANGAALGGTGTIAAPVTVANGGTIEAGAASGTAVFTLKSLALGAVATDAMSLNFDATPQGVDSLNVSGVNGVTNNGTVTINVSGTLPAASPVVYTLITYSGTIKGTGSFVLGTLPDSAVAYLSNSAAASALQLVISSVTIPSVTWNGTPTANWDLLGANVWKLTGTSTAAAYADGDQTVFDDSAANFNVNLAATVNPNGVTVSNLVNNYVIGGNGGISGFTGLTKLGVGKVTLSTSNNYTGATTISAGTLTLGVSNAIPSGASAGNVTVNGTLDVAGFSPTLVNLSGNGLVDDITAGGAPNLVLANTAGSAFAGVIQNSSGTVTMVKSGSGTLSLSGANTYSGATLVNSGTLQLGAGGSSGSAGTGQIMDNATLAFNRSDSLSFSNDITGTGAVQQNGSGTVTLRGNLTYTGTTTVNSGVLAFPHDITFDASTGTTLNIGSGAMVQMSATIFSMNVNSTGVASDVTGAGTLQLTSTLNSIESFSDINFGPNHSGALDSGCRLGCNLDLGSVHRTVYGWSGRNDVTRFLLTGCDCQFAGSISGSAELTLEGQNSFPPGVNTMEVPFAFNAANTFTGPLEIRRGSLYLGNANALTKNNVLILDPAVGVNSRLFLYGFNAAISDLQTTGGYGTSLIANGNNSTTTNVGPATLTITQNNPTTFNGSIVDWFAEYAAATAGSLTPTLSLVKSGTAALTLTGSNTYSGTTVINAGKLYFDGPDTGGGAFTVNSGGTLGGSNAITSTVTVMNGGAVEGGAGNANGNLSLKALTLGSVSSDASVLNLATGAILQVTNNNGLKVNSGAASVTVNVGGSIVATGAYPLITYAGTIQGTGYSAFKLGSLPPGSVGILSNDTVHSSVDILVTSVTSPRWSGALSASWNTSVLSAPKNWVLNSDGVSQIDYVDGEGVFFDDTAIGTTANIDTANVSPFLVTVNNAAKQLTITGAFGISGSGGLTKQGAGILTLSSPNTYIGNTTINAGTLAVGSASAIPSGPQAGNVVVNGTLDVGGFSPSVNNLSGSGIIDNVSAGGSPVLSVVVAGSNNFAGSFRNTTGNLSVNVSGGGTLTLGGNSTLAGAVSVNNATLNVNGQVGSGGVAMASGGVLSGTGTVTGSATLADGSALLLTANSPLTVGPLALNGKVSVTAAGSISLASPGTYTLLKHGAETGSGSFTLVQLSGLNTSLLFATLVDTNNQLQLVIQPVALTGTIADVRHVVVFVQENRSFDHYLGTLHGVHGFSDHNAMQLSTGSNVFYQPTGSTYELPYHTSVSCINDLDHSWGATHNAIDSDRNDGWIAAKGTETMAYYNRSDLPYYYGLADAYTVLDDYHCSVRASTDPNRVSLMTGMIDPNGTGAATINGTTYPGGPLIDNTEPSVGWGPGWVTYPELLQKAGISWMIYQQTDNYDDNALAWFSVFKQAPAGSALNLQGNTFSANVVTQFSNDVSSNVLPAVSWIIGPTAQTEHPPYSPESGENLTKEFLDALAANPVVFSNTVFIITYDENDGFYDHSLPITPPAGTASEFVSGLPIGLGVRVPAIIVSPWTRASSSGGFVCSQVFDHTSIIRFIETWTGVREPNISPWRRQVCGDLTSAFDFAHPRYDYPSLPSTTPISCGSGSTPAVPSPQVVPTQESGTLTPRPLPYQPNAFPVPNCAGNSFGILMTNSGSASVHFLVVPNAYRLDAPSQFDLLTGSSTTFSYSTAGTSGKYDLSCYSPDGFQRRFVGNLTGNCGTYEVSSYLNASTGGIELALANTSGSAVTFSVSNGYTGFVSNVLVAANGTSAIGYSSPANFNNYDLTATTGADTSFLRRFLGQVQTNNSANNLVSSENPGGFGDNVKLTSVFTGFGTPTGTVQFKNNGAAIGSPVMLTGGTAALNTSALPRGTDLITAEYSGDLLNAPATNSLTQTVTNHPPLALLVSYARPANISLKIKISDLLTNVSDADGDPVAIVGFGADGFNMTSTNGASLKTNSTYVLYTNSVTPNVNDAFSYSVTDGQGGTSLGTVAIIMNNNVFGQSNVVLNVSTSSVMASFFGVPGFRYTVERSTNLTSGVGLGWVPISTNTAPTGGLIQVNDDFHDLGIPIPPVPSPAYYRLRYNP